MDTLLLVVGALMLCGALFFAFSASSTGAAFAYLGVLALRNSDYIFIDSSTLLFWAVAVLIVLFTEWMQTRSRRMPQVCRNYIVGGALVGMMAGVTLGNAAMIVGSAVGAVLGGVAYRRTSSGAIVVKTRMWIPIIEIGLPSVVTMTLVGLVLDSIR